MPERTVAETVNSIITYWGLWWIGWAAVYINRIRQGAKFNIFMLIANIVLAWYVWWITGELLPANEFKNSLVSISWFLAYPLLDLLEKEGINLFINRVLWKK